MNLKQNAPKASTPQALPIEGPEPEITGLRDDPAQAGAQKRVHGAPIPFWEKLGLREHPPVPCEFTLGERVVFTNEYGLSFDCQIIGFADEVEDFNGGFIHLIRHGKTSENGSAWWFPHAPSELAHHSQAAGEA